MTLTNLEKAENDRRVLSASLTLVEQAILVHDVSPIDEADCEIYLEDIKLLKVKLIDIHTRIANCKPADMDPHQAEFSDLSVKLHKAISFLTTLRKTFTKPEVTTASSSASSSMLKLPRIDLPTFSGKFEDWYTFKDLFSANVHTSDMTDANKLVYLKKYVSGEAAQLIDSMATTNANYSAAWTLLLQRYENQRIIVSSHIKKLFSIEPVKSANAVSIKHIIDQTNQALRGVRSIQPDEKDLLSSVILHMTLEKLDVETKRHWSLQLRGTTPPTYDQLCEYLEEYVHSLEQSTAAKPLQNERKASAHATTVSNHGAPSCPICKTPHFLYKCTKFLALSVKQRKECLNTHALCYNCLKATSKTHKVDTCKASSCKTCGKKHNTLLHYNYTPAESSSSVTSATSTTETSHHLTCPDTHVLLATAVVDIPDQHGQMHKGRIMLDSGSQATLVTEDFVQKHNLKRKWDNTQVSGVGNNSAGRTRGKVQLTLYSRVYNQYIIINAFILPQITKELPTYPCVRDWEHINSITSKLADPNYYMPGPVDILIGAEYTGIIEKHSKKEGSENGPSAKDTIFGWVLTGRVKTSFCNTVRVHTIRCETDTILERFWHLENIQERNQQLTQEEKICESHFVNTHYRDPSGRFYVQLPLKDKIKQLGYSREMAVNRWKSVEKRLAKNASLAEQYHNFMTEYIKLGHMQCIPRGEVKEIPSKTYYLPHHFVLKEDSTTTKLRVVFDGSAKSSTGVSLNDCLHVGATLQDDIFSLLLRFRKHKVAIKADVEKMFRQFEMQQSHCDLQRIVWRKDPLGDIDDYRLSTITYGTASAPFLSTRCLIQLAAENKVNYPFAAQKLEKDLFVDDLMTSCETEQQAEAFISDLNTIATSACLLFRKWSTNCPIVLKSIPAENVETHHPFTIDRDNNVKALGVQWNPDNDNFCFKRPVFDNAKVLTKRIVLSQLARVFDPLGFLSPVTVRAKLFMQQLWKCDLSWDEPLTPQLCNQWTIYRDELDTINNIQIPRWINPIASTTIQLIGFSDSSEKGYGAIVYLRCISKDNISIRMVASKSRVCPIKNISLPRLELCAALVLAELIVAVKTALDIECETFGYTDSMIVLQWLASHPGRWQTFVANRVSKIQEVIQFEFWNHVASSDNPADLVSRGVKVEELNNNSLWWTGPSWLSLPVLPPKVDVKAAKMTQQHEERKKTIFVAHVNLDNYYEQFSSFSRMQRVFAYILRFKNNCTSEHKLTGHLTVPELTKALHVIIRVVQREYFPEDFDSLQTSDVVPAKSKLISLSPYFDKDKIIRVGGRLNNANLPFAQAHPIIIPHGSHFAKLLINQAHILLLHGGQKLVWCYLRSNYWILNARNTIRAVLRKCVKCRRHNNDNMTQFMASLPAVRVNPSRPFQNCGVDYAGPFNLKLSKGRTNKLIKSYFCIIVCMATKAVHLEPVSNLTTDSFIATLRRFVSRRGLPSVIHSDCGTNFIGADKELRRLLVSDDHNRKIADQLSTNGVEWKFNAPSSPHHGGLWESGVKSVKNHMKRVIGEQTLTFEEFTTVLCQVEACLNSRPLCALTSEPDDLNVLTPGHFLIGQPITMLPDPDLTHLKINRLSRWQLVQQMTQHFWKRWNIEYLSTLQQRWKWQHKQRNISVGDLCVLQEENMPVTKWRLCRVVDVHPGQDGLIRTVTIKTTTGVYKRPIVKLTPILFREEQS